MNARAPSDAAAQRRQHVTVACVVPRDDTFLMVEEAIHGRPVFNQPAGHLELGETLLQAAIRETREETGWQVEPTHLVGIQQWANGAGQFLRFAFAARPLAQIPGAVLDAGILRACWMDRVAIRAHAEAGRLRSPMVLRSIDDFLAGKRIALDALVDLMP